MTTNYTAMRVKGIYKDPTTIEVEYTDDFGENVRIKYVPDDPDLADLQFEEFSTLRLNDFVLFEHKQYSYTPTCIVRREEVKVLGNNVTPDDLEAYREAHQDDFRVEVVEFMSLATECRYELEGESLTTDILHYRDEDCVLDEYWFDLGQDEEVDAVVTALQPGDRVKLIWVKTDDYSEDAPYEIIADIINIEDV